MDRRRFGKEETNRPLLSSSSILIFSSFLIGLASGNSLPDHMGRLVFLSGLIGLIAYLALGLVAWRQRCRAAERANLLATSQLEQRLNRHAMPSGPMPSRRLRRHLSEEEEQYLPVVSTSRIGFGH